MSGAGLIWVVDDDRSIRWVLEKALEKADFEVESFEDGNNLLNLLGQKQPDAIISDIRMPNINGLDLLEKIHTDFPELPVIIMTAYSDLDSAVSAYESGAFEYLPKPFDVDAAIEQVNRAIAHAKENARESVQEVLAENNVEIIGSAPSMQEVFRAIGRLTKSSVTVLITGESGTGKELVAQALYRHSPRATKDFIALNTAAIPKDLLESELFGHEKGSFTGAQAQRKGRFEQSDGGTLFLDEIGDMPAELQTRLLRVLADGQFYRIGGHSAIHSDVRVIAATHQDLDKLVEEGKFREDLYHRLNVIRIHIPPLRERREDIGLLASRFLKSTAKELNVETKTLLPETIEYLSGLQWPGNVRQLENVCRWLSVMAAGNMIHINDLPPELFENKSSNGVTNGNWEELLKSWASEQLLTGEEGLLKDALPRFEKVLLDVALTHTAGRKQDAAKLLGWGRNTVTRKLKELNIS